ncbi:hypothetical protein BG011_006156 [Mortierella polycephala]|uniref:Uncharacterized protein n=1 Tax=Mortierella polycephala TaxID=41804 RepID=A0A9P6U0C3_9FUNG|nr:hypothetical protein BG011_006156 [Mortierella polycephala]
MTSISLHQTSRHAVLVIHTHVDTHSVMTQISSTHDSVHISYRVQCPTQDQSSIAQPVMTVMVQPQLQSSVGSNASLSPASVQECSYSVSPENLVIKFTKPQLVEWQALQIQFKSQTCNNTKENNGDSNSAVDMEVDQGQERELGQEESILAKFVTPFNASQHQGAIRSSLIWETQQPQVHVGNIQAARIPGMNAIQITAELIPSIPITASS